MSDDSADSDGLDPADLAAVEAVLAGEVSYDAVNGNVQAVVRERLETRIRELREGLDLEAEFRAQGIPGSRPTRTATPSTTREGPGPLYMSVVPFTISGEEALHVV